MDSTASFLCTSTVAAAKPFQSISVPVRVHFGVSNKIRKEISQLVALKAFVRQ
jgi:hypothetical protein